MSLWASAVGEIHVLLAALVLFGIIPAWALAGTRRLGGSASSTLAAGLAFWIVVVTALAYVAAVRYAVLFMVVAVALVFSMRRRLRERSSETRREESIRLWDSFERPLEAMGDQVRRMRRSLADGVLRLRQEYGWIGLLLMLVSLAWALGYGSWPWLHQADPGTPQGYTNLLRIANLSANTGVYSSGTAPPGLAALGGALSTAFFLPPLDVLRFLYPLADLFTVMAIGALARQLTRSGPVTALVMFLASLSSLAHLGFPVNFESPLAMRWALILVFLAWAEAMAWVDDPKPWHALLSGVSLLGASLLSPPEAAVGWAVTGVMTVRAGWKVVGWGGLAVLLGCLPLLGGLAAGFPWSPEGWLEVPFPLLAPVWRNLGDSAYWVVWIGLALAIINTLRPVTPLRRHLSWAVGGLALAALALGWNATVASMILWSDILGLLVLILGLDLLLVPAVERLQYQRGVSIVLIGVAVAGALLPAGTVTLARFEPSLAGRVTLHIEEALPPYQWTIVSPVQQYSEVLSRGWHDELASFVTTYSIQEAENPHFTLKHDARFPILTPDVFLFVEPHLFPTGQAVSKRDLTLPVAGGAGAYAGASFRAVEARAYYWALAYHRAHPKTSQFYVQGRDLMVLWIRQ
ncbi:MAG: hypothetical protein M1272_00190 [Firmicutes bacterium]|nr:hypothetical protein [Bacillota bacterium]